MEYLLWFLSLLCGYVIGNFQTAILISRLRYHDDVRNHGSGNSGTTNMLRVFGIGPGALTFAGDFLKGLAAVAAGWLIGGEVGGCLSGLGAVLGHDFPVFFKLKGGKGVASALGIAWMLDPLCAAIATAAAFTVIFTSKMVSLGSLIGITVFLAAAVIMNMGNWLLLGTVAILWVLIILRHTDNIRRLIKGEENKLLQRKKDVTNDKSGGA